MENSENSLGWSPETYSEIIGDMLGFENILSIKRRMKNIEAKCYVSQFLKILAPIYSNEIITLLKNKGASDKLNSLPRDLVRFIASQRNSILKGVVAKSKKVPEVEQNMELSFREMVYDMNVVVKSGKLLDMNFEDYYSSLDNEEMWETMFAIPASVLQGLIHPEIDDLLYNYLDSSLSRLSKDWDQRLSGKRYSYSSFKLFASDSSLEKIDKLFILYRYRMVSSIRLIQELESDFPLQFADQCYLNANYFYRKYRALIIVIIGNELQSMTSTFAQDIKADFIKLVDPKFFPLNRRLRNNLHYGKISEFTTEEMAFIDHNQYLYLDILMEHMLPCLVVDIDPECEFMTEFSRAYAESGISREEFRKRYEHYYNLFKWTGSLY